ncbi:MAG: GntR family transcriptional regulator [Sphaerochaetaceae bacterium]
MSNAKPLYEVVYEDIKQKILSDEYKDGSLLPSEREIGEHYDVERTTVRKVLKMLVEDLLVVKLPGIGTKITKTKDTRNNSSQQTKENKNKGTIGFFLPPSLHRIDRISQPFYSMLFYYTEKEARSLGYSFSYYSLCENEDFEALLKSQEFDGIIFVSNISDKCVQLALSKGIPSVLVNEYNPKIISILADNTNGMVSICNHLIELGHQDFLLVTGIPTYLSCKERLMGCKYSFQKHNISKFSILSCDWEPETAYQITKEYLLQAKSLPTAIIAFNDNIAFGCLRAINDIGLKVPTDISVVGFDDIEQSNYSIPPLTTVHENINLMAKTAIQEILMQIEHPTYFSQFKIILPSSVIIRKSTAEPSTKKENPHEQLN